ncbi:NAD+ synthase [Candidatus Phycosocius spiralis]|uniref:Glutamine-dependent NAD(+) synthetase n=1 Tax=Candidatus Phycosocius spiralis TaxID=2815099 RepID=A0ABQ4PS50_9PROT|nr:NAD+ synthase [Candidatus Phycosocius spiralis]GIU65849.1 NAD+ synthase [Candidatus Phycosocius spiralis]
MQQAKPKLRIVSVQLNPIVGDIVGNRRMAEQALEIAAHSQADIVVFSELFIIGYPPEDLVLKPAAVRDCRAAIDVLAHMTADLALTVVIGTPWRTAEGLFNAVVVLSHGEIQAVRYKHELPNYAVFDEKRVFDPGPLPSPVDICGVRIGIPICEDIWFDRVTHALHTQGAQLLLVPNGSPYRRGVTLERLACATERVYETKVPLLYVNQVGGQDELCFDGGSFALSHTGECVQSLSNFRATLAISDWQWREGHWICVQAEQQETCSNQQADYAAMVLALRDYVNKNGFPSVILGLSGGIDSALSAAVATDALGPQRVTCLMMPSRFTSQESLADAKDNAARLGTAYHVLPIEGVVAGFTDILDPHFEGTQSGIAEENIQSRARGVLLMALSNKFGQMVLTTGNKSEMAVGYATLYGDMCGGYNVLKDLYKMQVYTLARWRNANTCEIGLGPAGEVIPQRIIDKAPSAELRDNQTDQDSLPPYPVLDDILHAFVEEEAEIEEVIARGHAPELVHRIQNLLYLAEYKRRQAPPGVKLGSRNFGRDRRYPITNRYRDRN